MSTRSLLDPTEEEVRVSSIRSLSGREREILLSLLRGQSNKAIARGLGITEGTVKVHLGAVMRKLNVTNRTAAAVLAVRYAIHLDSSAADRESKATTRFALARDQE